MPLHCLIQILNLNFRKKSIVVSDKFRLRFTDGAVVRKYELKDDT